MHDGLGPFCDTKKSELGFIDIELDGLRYRRVLEVTKLPMVDDLQITWKFLHDGAPLQRSIVVEIWLKIERSRVLEYHAHLRTCTQLKTTEE